MSKKLLRRPVTALAAVLLSAGVITGVTQAGGVAQAAACNLTAVNTGSNAVCGGYDDPSEFPPSNGYTGPTMEVQAIGGNWQNATVSLNSAGLPATGGAPDYTSVVNAPAAGGAVQVYPSIQQDFFNWNSAADNWTGSGAYTPFDNLSALTVGYSETDPGDGGTGSQYEWGLDLWTEGYPRDIMFWTDTTAQRCQPGGYGTIDLGQLTLGGKPWTATLYGGKQGEIILYEDGSSGTASTCAQQTSGTIDVLGGLNWLQNNDNATTGYPAADGGSGANGLEMMNTGWEITQSAAGDTYTQKTLTYNVTTTAGGGSPPAQTPPVATSAPINGEDDTGAILAGSVNPEGADTSYKFDYGTTTAYGSSSPATDAGSGTSAVNETYPLTGLQPNTTYHYRIEATNSGGTTDGADEAFTTSAPANTPVATTGASSGVTASAATIAGTVNPEGTDSSYQFDYGTTTAYGSSSLPQDAGSGSTAVSESTKLSGLSAGTTYHYRIEATSNVGTTDGADGTFTTTGTPPGTPPGTVTIVQPAGNYTHYFLWAPVAGASDYQAEIENSSGTVLHGPGDTAGGTWISSYLTPISGGFKVQVRDEVKGVWSAWNTAQSFT